MGGGGYSSVGYCTKLLREGPTTTSKGKGKVTTGARELLPLSGFILIDSLLVSLPWINISCNKLEAALAAATSNPLGRAAGLCPCSAPSSGLASPLGASLCPDPGTPNAPGVGTTCTSAPALRPALFHPSGEAQAQSTKRKETSVELCKASRPRGEGSAAAAWRHSWHPCLQLSPGNAAVPAVPAVPTTPTAERRGHLPREQKGTEEFSFGHHYAAVEAPSSFLGCLGSG